MTDTPRPAGVRLLGGEMLGWTDGAVREHGATDEVSVDNRANESGEQRSVVAGGPALTELVIRTVRAGDRILVAGPHTQELYDALAERASHIACVRRSLPDATRLARLYANRRDLDVHCGGIERYDTLGTFDVVIALGGPETLLSTDSPELSWEGIVRCLASAVAPGGLLLVGAENELGLHRISGVHPSRTHRGNHEWAMTPARPAHAGDLAEILDRTGLPLARCYAAYPLPETPSALLSVDGLAAGRLPLPGLSMMLAAACARGLADRPVLSDPSRTVRSALRAGLGAGLAASWIAVARRPAADQVLPELPDALIAEGAGYWSTVCELQAEGDGGLHRRLCGDDAATRAIGSVVREPGRLTGGVPVGETLDELLRDACERQDTPALRRLLRDYATWLVEQGENGDLTGTAVFATPDNVIVEGTGFSILDSSWEWAGQVPAQQVLARSLRRFLIGLVISGQRHPWPLSVGIDRLCMTLHAMAGHPAAHETLDAGLRLEAEVVAIQEDLSEEKVFEGLRLATGMPGAVVGHRELVATNARLQDEVGTLREQIRWMDQTLVAKEEAMKRAGQRLEEAKLARQQLRAKLRELRQQNRALRGSIPFKAARIISSPARRAQRAMVKN